MKIEYYKQLADIRNLLENLLQGFPLAKCQHATRIVKQIIGLEELAGEYTPKGMWHAWNYDTKLGLYVDLTQDQFTDSAGKVCILPEYTSILKEMPERTVHQRNKKDPDFTKQVKILIDIYNKLHI